MSSSRTVRVDGPTWARLQGSGPGPEPLASALAEHRVARVRGLVTAVGGVRGVRTRVTVRGGQVVVIARRLARVEGETRVEPGALVSFCTVEAMWPAVARMLPDVDVLRASSRVAAGPVGRSLELSQQAAAERLEREEFAVQVRVEARPTGDGPVVEWAKQWSVADGRLVDVRLRGRQWALTERSAGSVAAELRWAIIGAIDATGGDGSIDAPAREDA